MLTRELLIILDKISDRIKDLKSPDKVEIGEIEEKIAILSSAINAIDARLQKVEEQVHFQANC